MLKRFAVLSLFAIFLCAFSMRDCDDPKEACLKAADLWASAYIRCGDSTPKKVLEQTFIDTVAYGSCASVERLRDPAALADKCLPWLETVSCDVLVSGRLLPACENIFVFTSEL